MLPVDLSSHGGPIERGLLRLHCVVPAEVHITGQYQSRLSRVRYIAEVLADHMSTLLEHTCDIISRFFNS